MIQGEEGGTFSSRAIDWIARFVLLYTALNLRCVSALRIRARFCEVSFFIAASTRVRRIRGRARWTCLSAAKYR